MIRKVLLVSIALMVGFLLIAGHNNIAFASNRSDTEVKGHILSVLNNLKKAANEHDIIKVASYYSNNYTSGDHLNKSQVLNLIKDTWKTYPDIHYSTEITDIRYSDNWAAVETHDRYNGTTGKVSDITNDKGTLYSESHSVVYLRRIGKEWKIVSDLTYYEKAIVRYGNAQDLDISFSAPEQVNAGQMYSASISLEVPVGSFAVGSITQEPIIYPSIKPKEKFRTINQNMGDLERVFESNETNNNELVTATVGITELTEDNQARPTVKLKGICIIGKRVNVVPESTFDREEYKITHKENLELSPSEMRKFENPDNIDY